MKKVLIFFGMMIAGFTPVTAQQRVVAECTITYSLITDSTADKELYESLKSAYKIVYIKGNNCRNDLVSPAFSQSTFIDKAAGKIVVLREFGNNKFITTLNNAQWAEANRKFAGMVLNPTNETKTILGYSCKKAILQLKDSSIFILYYTPSIIPSVKEFEYQFKEIPGFVMEYETSEAGKKIHFIATKINLSPVPLSKFEIPVNDGYRVLD